MKLIAIAGLVLVVVSIITVVLMWAWSWVVPDVFAGAVKAELLPASLTFVQALKLSIFLSVFGLTRSSGKK